MADGVGDLTPSRSSPTLSLRKERVKIIRKDFKPQQACSYSLTLSFLKERVGEERDGVRSLDSSSFSLPYFPLPQ